MHRLCLVCLRFCLSAWLGIAIFFVTVVHDLLDSVLTDRPGNFNHINRFLGPYFGFAFSLLGIALLCAVVGLWSAQIGLLRRCATLLFVLAAVALAAVDCANYRTLAGFLTTPTAIPAAQFVMVFQRSRPLKGAVLALSIVATGLAFWPDRFGDRNDESSPSG
jgi:hypothetical protein